MGALCHTALGDVNYLWVDDGVREGFADALSTKIVEVDGASETRLADLPADPTVGGIGKGSILPTKDVLDENALTQSPLVADVVEVVRVGEFDVARLVLVSSDSGPCALGDDPSEHEPEDESDGRADDEVGLSDDVEILGTENPKEDEGDGRSESERRDFLGW